MVISFLSRRPFLVTPWSIWIKPGLKLKYRDIWHVNELEKVGGKTRLHIIDEMDREYWIRLKPHQWRLFCLFNEKTGGVLT